MDAQIIEMPEPRHKRRVIRRELATVTDIGPKADERARAKFVEQKCTIAARVLELLDESDRITREENARLAGRQIHATEPQAQNGA